MQCSQTRISNEEDEEDRKKPGNPGFLSAQKVVRPSEGFAWPF